MQASSFTLSYTVLRCAVLPHQAGLVVYCQVPRSHADRPLWLALSRPALPGNSGPMLPAGLPLCRRFSHSPGPPLAWIRYRLVWSDQAGASLSLSP